MHMRFCSVFAGIAVLFAAGPLAWAQTVFINEFHYENQGPDAGEGVEIAGPAGTNLADYDVVLYNGSNGASYNTTSLSGILPNEAGTGFGARWFAISGIQNGDPDGIALVRRTGALVVQRFAWEGSFTGTNGPANGLVFSDPGIKELDNASNPAGRSLQLTGTGTVLSAFTWSGPAAASPGLINAGQSFGAPQPVSLLTLSAGIIREGSASTATLSLMPAPGVAVTVNLSSNPPGVAGLPPSVMVSAGGTLTFSVSALVDGIPDGFQETAILATPVSPTYPAAAAALQVIDADRPARSAPGVLRVATFNVKLGTGAPGSPEFAAVREVMERVSPDILLMQEVSDAGDFGDARALLEQAGFPTGPTYVATAGDAFAGQSYISGDFGTGECLVTASRYPLTSAVQIGRRAAGVSGPKELTRFPLYTLVDLPGADLHVVNVHLKASTTDADNFRKAIECYRVREFLTQRGVNAGVDPVIAGGDCNAIDYGFQPATSYNTATSPGAFVDGSTLPTTMVLGTDLSASPGVNLPFRIFPHQGFNPAGLYAPALYQADGVTTNTFVLSDARYDYLFIPQRLLTAGNARGEVYNSRLEPQAHGLPKRPTLPAPELSETASDHYLTFLDFNLSPRPALNLSVLPAARDESSTAAPPMATVSLNPPPSSPVTVALGPWRNSRVSFAQSTVVLTPAQPSAGVPVLVPNSPLVEPTQVISLTATASGYAPAYANLTVRSAEVSGSLVFSQYIEPSTAGTAPNSNTSRAVEIFNASGQPLDLARLQWLVRRYTNGSLTPSVLGQVTEVFPDIQNAWLLPGKVLVIGEAATGDAMVAAGLLTPVSGAPTFSSALAGTLFCNASAANPGTYEAVFLKGSNMDFTGNDALEILADGVRCDVFGRIGQDPGTAWTGGPGNPSTADQNLSLRPEIVTGSQGFTQPGQRFITTAAGNALTGLGIPPSPTDRYFIWAASQNLSGLSRAPNSDPDGDGRLNLIEFLQETNPLRGDAAPGVISSGATGAFSTLNADAWLSLTWERSDFLSLAWLPAPEVSGTPDGPTRTLWQWNAAPSAARRCWRLRASRP